MENEAKIIIFLQLLAWRKLELTNKIDPDKFFSKIQGDHLNIFAIHKTLSELSQDYDSFRVDDHALQSIPVEEFRSMVKSVSEIDLSDFTLESLYYVFKTNDLNASYETSEIIIDAAKLHRDDNIYCSNEWLAFKAAEISNNVTLQTAPVTPIPFLFNILFNKQVNILKPSDSIGAFNVSLVALPFTHDLAKQIERFLDRTYKRAILIVPERFLFLANRTDVQLKKKLVLDEILEAVVSLGNSSYFGVNANAAILVINKLEKQNETLFVQIEKPEETQLADLSRNEEKNNTKSRIAEILRNKRETKQSVLIGKSQCAENNYNLLPNRYLGDESLRFFNRVETYPLDRLFDTHRPQSLRDHLDNNGDEYSEASVSAIPEYGYISLSHKLKKIRLSSSFKSRFNDLILQPGDIIFPIKGSVGKVGIVPPEIEDNIVANQSSIILRLKPEIIEDRTERQICLYTYLTSKIAQAQISKHTMGTGIKFIQMRDLRAIQIPDFLDKKLMNEVLEKHRLLMDQYSHINEIMAHINKIKYSISELFI